MTALCMTLSPAMAARFCCRSDLCCSSLYTVERFLQTARHDVPFLLDRYASYAIGMASEVMPEEALYNILPHESGRLYTQKSEMSGMFAISKVIAAQVHAQGVKQLQWIKQDVRCRSHNNVELAHLATQMRCVALPST